jgi:hypothetical protein
MAYYSTFSAFPREPVGKPKEFRCYDCDCRTYVPKNPGTPYSQCQCDHSLWRHERLRGG